MSRTVQWDLWQTLKKCLSFKLDLKYGSFIEKDKSTVASFAKRLGMAATTACGKGTRTVNIYIKT